MFFMFRMGGVGPDAYLDFVSRPRFLVGSALQVANECFHVADTFGVRVANQN